MGEALSGRRFFSTVSGDKPVDGLSAGCGKVAGDIETKGVFATASFLCKHHKFAAPTVPKRRCGGAQRPVFGIHPQLTGTSLWKACWKAVQSCLGTLIRMGFSP